jgi:2-polyprenyl-3-methyl-5-hydroxy-6-metoxy-1,4-benzoquinol methylase
MSQATTPCIACGGTDIRQAYQKLSFPILRCAGCGLGRTALADDFDPEQYYSAAYFDGRRSDGYANYAGSERILRGEFRETLRRLLTFEVRQGRLLEFGCAYGFFLDEARTVFGSAHGIEISEDAARVCRSRGLDVVSGVVDEATLVGKYDVVVGLDVIEHVPDPRATLALLAAHMDAAAVLMMTTGDWSSWLARLTGPKWRLMTPPQHLSFFTAQAMRRMLEATGFRVLSLNHPWKRVPLSLIAFQLQRLAGREPRPMPMLDSLALPVNLWDAMRVVAVKR